jgi:hypothetical protein
MSYFGGAVDPWEFLQRRDPNVVFGSDDLMLGHDSTGNPVEVFGDIELEIIPGKQPRGRAGRRSPKDTRRARKTRIEKRRNRVLELISDLTVAEISETLAHEGFESSESTINRDLEALGLVTHRRK